MTSIVFNASRFAKHLRIVDHMHLDTERGKLYEVVDVEEEGAGKSRKTKCKTSRCRDFALRVYEISYSAEKYGIDSYLLRQSQGLGLDHPNLLKIHDIDLVFADECKDVITYECKDAHMLVLLELASGNLVHWMELHKKTRKLDDLVRFAFDILCGLRYLHQHKFVHRRLHPKNIMMVEVESRGDKDRMTAKIGDYQDMMIYSTTTAPATRTNDNVEYMAPETLVGERYSQHSDMWSVGILLFEMLVGCGKTPFMTDDDRLFKANPRKFVTSRIFQWLGTPDLEWRTRYMHNADIDMDAEPSAPFLDKLKENFPECFPMTPIKKMYFDLIAKCLVMDPDQRITAEQALKHPLFAKKPCQEQRTRSLIPLTPLRPFTPKPWAETRHNILDSLEKDLENGFARFYPSLMALYIFDQCPGIFKDELPELKNIHGFASSCFCAAYLIATKLLLDDLPEDPYKAIQGVVCGSTEANRVNILFLEREIAKAMRFRFESYRIARFPVDPSVFKQFRNQIFIFKK